ncbi:MAG: helix-turn-helix domain-containing protein, partial [Alphaproteobacteria bacterium]|nr:helix-turn-helix domain-containing protein [Alphaproteobacteria bacterium]
MAERKRARFKVLDDGRRDGPPPEAEGELAPSSAVAATLRKARMASGRSVQEVADLLRIRRAYLTAIEEGRFADLPGPAYAVGFVRSFADHLGLDSDGLVDRFKEEIASVGSLDKRTDLTFPEPVSEGRVPNVPLLLIAVGLAAAIYGGWYYYSTRDRIAVDRVPEPPVLAGQRAEPSAAEPAPVVSPTEEAADSEAPVDRAPQEAAAPSEASPVPAPPERPAGESERPSEGAVGAEAPATSVT